MQTAEERPIPFTRSRASTELIQSRKQLDAARRSLVLALEIFGGLDRNAGAAPSILVLERVLTQIEEAEATLWEVAH